jgi:hypothetical protein
VIVVQDFGFLMAIKMLNAHALTVTGVSRPTFSYWRVIMSELCAYIAFGVFVFAVLLIGHIIARFMED